MKRPLPTAAEAAEILAHKRTRPARPGPPAVGRRLTRLVKSLDERFGQGLGGLGARWREVVGDPLARATEPVRLIASRSGAGGTLEIRVDGPAAALIQHQAPQILERANLFLGAGAVTRLRIVQGPVRSAAASPRPRPARRVRPPLDAAKEAELAASVEASRDPDLASALVRLGRGVLRADPPR